MTLSVEDVKDRLRLRAHDQDLHPTVAVEIVDNQLAGDRASRDSLDRKRRVMPDLASVTLPGSWQQRCAPCRPA